MMSDKKINISLYLSIVIRFTVFILTMGGFFLYLSMKTFYWQGWVFFGIHLTFFLLFMFLFRDKMDLMMERIKPGPGIKEWDKIFFAFYVPLNLTIFILSPLDGGKFHWSPDLPLYIYILAYAAYLSGVFVTVFAMWMNQFFSSIVRIQKERGHYVITDGPYKVVRHPGYSGAILLLVSMPIILGSLYGLIPAFLVVILLIIRTALEDKTLQHELEGYKGYTKQTKYRLLPGVW
jgi:protein-S-isoprenylcysteine O-methyltransferase Ste14